MRSIFAVIILCLLSSLASCGPTFKTTYNYEPPDDDGGLRCLFQCERSEGLCRRIKKLERQSCRNRNENRYIRCVERNRFRRRNQRIICNYGTCPFPDYQICEVEFRRCYENCGGTVTSFTECTKNCDQIKIDGDEPNQ